MDNAEFAARILARALGYGSSWHAKKDFGAARRWVPEPCACEKNPNAEDTPEVALSGTLEEDIPDTDNSLPIRKEVRLSSEKRETPIRGVSEFKRWSGERVPTDGKMVGPQGRRVFVESKTRRIGRTATAIIPKVETGARAMIALAGIDKPLQAILLLYATTDGRHWPVVERYARACLPTLAHAGIEEAMYRVLVHTSHRESAKRLRMRESDYVDLIRPALTLFDDWLERGSDQFLQQHVTAKHLLELHKSIVR